MHTHPLRAHAQHATDTLGAMCARGSLVHRVTYTDGDVKWHDLSAERVIVNGSLSTDPRSSTPSKKRAASPSKAGGAKTPKASPAKAPKASPVRVARAMWSWLTIVAVRFRPGICSATFPKASPHPSVPTLSPRKEDHDAVS